MFECLKSETITYMKILLERERKRERERETKKTKN